jgi:predicted MFS family arabinose efflux permease
VLALPSGVWLAQHYGYGLVTLAAAAAALAPLTVLGGLPGRTRRTDRTRHTDRDRRQAAPAPAHNGAPLTLRDGLRQPALRRTSLIFAATTVPAGVVVAFLPLAGGASGQSAAAGLFAQAVTAALGRWWGGRLGDRHGHASLLAPGLLLSVAGMALAAAAGFTALGAWLPITAMAIFGTGFGITQNATFAMMIDRVPAAGYGAASALWNLAYDAGYGAGPAVLGLLAARAGYGAAFAATVVIMLGAVRPSWRERRAGRAGRASRAGHRTR